MLKLREIRIKKGLKQQDIANILGITQAAASRIESEERKIDGNQIIKLCLALDVSPNELLGFDEAYKKYTDFLKSLEDDVIEN